MISIVTATESSDDALQIAKEKAEDSAPKNEELQTGTLRVKSCLTLITKRIF